MMTGAAAIAALIALGGARIDVAQGFSPAEETPESLPDGPGRDETFYMCTGCHGIALVKAQGLSSERWDETIDVMITKHGMAEIPAEDRAVIVKYLASAFPAKSRGQGGWQNPFLKK